MKTKAVISLALVLIGLVVLAAPTTQKPSVILGWTPPSITTNVAGYNIYWGVASRVYTNSIAVSGATSDTGSISNLARGVTYYFTATSYSAIGLESDYGNEVTWTTMPLPGAPVSVTVRMGNP